MCLVHMTTCAYTTRVLYGSTLLIPLHCHSGLKDSHVIPSLFHNAKENDTLFIVPGTGKPLMQFIDSIDLAKLFI